MSDDDRLIPLAVSRIYLETIEAFNSGVLILSGAGLRAVVEALCIDAKVDKGNLQTKIDALVGKGLLAKRQAELLHEERYLGNAALHELAPPARRDIEDGLTIVEALLTTLYIAPARAKRLREARHKRESGNAEEDPSPEPDTD